MYRPTHSVDHVDLQYPDPNARRFLSPQPHASQTEAAISHKFRRHLVHHESQAQNIVVRDQDSAHVRRDHSPKSRNQPDHSQLHRAYRTPLASHLCALSQAKCFVFQATADRSDLDIPMETSVISFFFFLTMSSEHFECLNFGQ